MFKKLSRTCFNFESAPDVLMVGLDDSCGSLPTETLYSVLQFKLYEIIGSG